MGLRISPNEFINFKRAYFIDKMYEARVGEVFCLEFDIMDNDIFYSDDCRFVLNYIRETYVADN